MIIVFRTYTIAITKVKIGKKNSDVFQATIDKKKLRKACT